MIRPLVLAAALALPPASAAPAVPSGPSARSLAAAYRGAKDPDARFWIVDALHRLAEEKADEGALEALLDASSDPEADVRRRALSGLEAWRALAPEARERWRARVGEAAERASRDGNRRVRDAAQQLSKALEEPAAPAGAAIPPRKAAGGGRYARGLALWMLGLQLAAFLWARLALSLLRQCGEPGRSALRFLSQAASRSDYLVFPCLSALLLLAIVGAGAGGALARGLAPGAAEPGAAAWLRFAGGFYAAWGLAVFVPAALLARRAGRAAAEGGALRAALSSLRDLPGAVALGALVLALWPFEPLLRRFGGERVSTPWRWLAAAGTPFGGYWTAALSAQRRVGWVETLVRAPEAGSAPAHASWLARPLGQGPLLLLYGAAPLVFSLSLVPARGLGADPSSLFDLWFLSTSGFAAAFGLWAGAIAVSIFLGFWSAAAALAAASLARGGQVESDEGTG